MSTPSDPLQLIQMLQQDRAAGQQLQDVHLEQLAHSLREQGAQYGNLLALLETLNSSADVQDTHSQAVLNSIQHQLQKATETGELCRELRQRLGDEVIHQSPALQQELQRQEQVLKQCLQRIAALETEFQQRRRRLKPEMDETARRRSMQSAYRQSLRTG